MLRNRRVWKSNNRQIYVIYMQDMYKVCYCIKIHFIHIIIYFTLRPIHFIIRLEFYVLFCVFYLMLLSRIHCKECSIKPIKKKQEKVLHGSFYAVLTCHVMYIMYIVKLKQCKRMNTACCLTFLSQFHVAFFTLTTSMPLRALSLMFSD